MKKKEMGWICNTLVGSEKCTNSFHEAKEEQRGVRGRENFIKENSIEAGYEHVKWIQVAQNEFQ
jgi:hypothetical protein